MIDLHRRPGAARVVVAQRADAICGSCSVHARRHVGQRHRGFRHTSRAGPTSSAHMRIGSVPQQGRSSTPTGVEHLQSREPVCRECGTPTAPSSHRQIRSPLISARSGPVAGDRRVRHAVDDVVTVRDDDGDSAETAPSPACQSRSLLMCGHTLTDRP